MRIIGLAVCLVGTFVFAHRYKEDSALYYGDYSETFVLRWAFQALCDHVYDMRTISWCTEPAEVAIDPKAVKKGGIVFVRDINSFIEDSHPETEHHYIIVTAGEFRDSVYPMHEPLLQEDKIIAWFSIHRCCPWFPEKFKSIPLGIRQDKECYDEREQMNKLFVELSNKPKEGLLCMNFCKDRCKEGICYQDRMDVYNIFKQDLRIGYPKVLS